MMKALSEENSANAIITESIDSKIRPNRLPTARPPIEITPANRDYPGHLVGRDREDVEQIEQNVQRHHQNAAQDQRARKVPLRILDLGADVGRGVPTAVAEHDPHQRQAGGLQAREVEIDAPALGQMFEAPATHGKAGDDQPHDEADLQHGQHVLHPGAELEPAVVDAHEDGDDQDGVELLQQRRLDRRLGHSEAGQSRKGPGQVFHDADRRSRDRRREPGEERDPAGQKAEQRVVQAREKNVLAAGFGDRRAELAIAQRPTQRDDPAADPQGDHQPGVTEILHQQTRSREDAGTDHVGDDDTRHREQPEPAP
jgi:hypothetical protein